MSSCAIFKNGIRDRSNTPAPNPAGRPFVGPMRASQRPDAKVKEKRLSQVSPAKRKPFGELKSDARLPIARMRQCENREQQGVEIVYLGTRGRG